MGFQFKLAAVLRVREIMELRELRRLEELQVEAVTLKQLLAVTDEAHRRCLRIQEAALGEGTESSNLNDLYRKTYECVERRSQLLLQIEQNRARQAEQMEHYKKARAEREMLSKLRERQLAEFEDVQLGREQKIVDDLVGLRHSRKKH